MAYFRSAPKSVPFTVSITPKDMPLIFLRQLVFSVIINLMNRGFPSPLETDYSAVGGGTPLFL